MVKIELKDIQGIILSGYAPLKAAVFVLLRVTDAAPARGWLAGLASRLTAAADSITDRAVNVAFTVDGLRALQLDEAIVGEFGAEFKERMHYYVRAGNLGDIGDSSSDKWLWGGPREPVHIVLLLYATDQPALKALYEAEVAEYRGVEEQVVLETRDLGGREHFGFRDALSQPLIEHDGAQSLGFGALRAPGPGEVTIKPGEFLLGYENESGRRQASPSVHATRDPGNELPRRDDGRGDLGRNGSYMVLRQLEQDVQGFWTFVFRHAHHPDQREWLAAKLVGRWRGGAPLVTAPHADDPRQSKLNAFGYQNRDPDGLRCPFGAHIRRANPRDWHVGPDPNSALAESKRHRLMRRGRPYGPPLSDDWDFATVADAATDGGPRGLHFLCFNADIRSQFEFVQWRWLNLRTFAGLSSDADPLVGAEPDRFTIQGGGAPLTGMQRFVTVRGGAYCFMLSLRAVRYLGGFQPLRS
jgi:Dyp-type peroxidase family